MCGIAGICLFAPHVSRQDLPARLTAMADAMFHRGPDDGGTYVSPDGRLGLASRRLAIRDLSPAGHMPMHNGAETVWIAYNGEVYNTDELRPELEKLGYVFRSGSDTEVILHGYEAWGEGVVERLRGMFAFAVVDLRAGPTRARFFMARDRLGIKPLFYSAQRDSLLFASELKALTASGSISRAIDPACVVGYLLAGSAPTPHTFYRDVRALEPGCSLVLDLGEQHPQPRVTRYWSFPTDSRETASYEEAVEEVREAVREAVRIRLVSDVPLGAFLSGGVDSSAVLALMRQATSGTIRTCSMVFEEQEFTEAPYARAMAELAGAEHFERVVTAADVKGELDRILWAMDQPTNDGVNSYFVSQTARQAGLTVALSGLGGDELFGGYRNTFDAIPRMVRQLSLIQRVPLGAPVTREISKLLPNRMYWAKARAALSRPACPATAYLARRGLFAPAEARSLVTSEVWEEAAKTYRPFEHFVGRSGRGESNGSLFAWISRAEIANYTHDQLLRDTDAMSMAHSLEVRVPLLDHRLVETVLRLPERYKVRPTADGAARRVKPLLVDAVGEGIAPVIRERTDKQGFTFPFAVWMQKELAPQVRELLLSPAGGILNRDAAEGVWKAFQEGQVHWSRAWSLVALTGWLSRHP